MKKVLLIAAVAVLATGCLGSKRHKFESKFNMVATFEYDDVGDGFNRDSTFFPEKFYSEGIICHYGKVNGTALDGGCGLSMGIDTVTVEGSAIRNPYFVYGTKEDFAARPRNTHMVFKQSSSMPEHIITAELPGDESTCEPYFMYVNNTNATIHAVRYGTGLSGGPFAEGDLITLTVTGYNGGVKTGEISVALADFKTFRDSVITKWTEVNLEKLGVVDEVSYSISSTRDDVPKLVCIDNCVYKIHILD